MNKVNRWEAPGGFIAIENVGNWSSCDGCKAIEEPYGECVFHSTEQAMCHCNYRKDEKVVTLREASKHYFIHTGSDECPKWLLKIAVEHPEWRLYCTYEDGSCDLTLSDHEYDKYFTVGSFSGRYWNQIKYFQIIPV